MLAVTQPNNTVTTQHPARKLPAEVLQPDMTERTLVTPRRHPCSLVGSSSRREIRNTVECHLGVRNSSGDPYRNPLLEIANMNRDTFATHLSEATAAVLALTRELIVEFLPESPLYYVFINPNHWSNLPPFEGDELVCPEDPFPATLVADTAESVINRLWRQGKVPMSIYIKVESQDNDHTYVSLECCNCFAGIDRIRHKCEGYPPFHCTGNPAPPNWDDVTTHGRFSLYWHARN